MTAISRPASTAVSYDPDLPYVFRRQPTFYRTLQPVGTVIIDKLQHFLYLIQPNNVALRYGIAVGRALRRPCRPSAHRQHGRMAAMAAAAGMLKRNPLTMPGGPGNPLGARLLELDDGTSRIHGTNAPKTIGNIVLSAVSVSSTTTSSTCIAV